MSLVLAQQGAQILTFPSAFTQITGSAHWEVCEQLTIALVLFFLQFFYLNRFAQERAIQQYLA